MTICLRVTCSTETVNDGQFHTVELLTFDQKLNLSVDGGEPMTLDGRGRSQAAAGEAPLYVGGEFSGITEGNPPRDACVQRLCVTAGLPEEALPLGPAAQTVNASFHGCIRNLYINHELQDFTRGHMKPGVEPGCGACRRLRCVHGVCRPDDPQVTGASRSSLLFTFTL